MHWMDWTGSGWLTIVLWWAIIVGVVYFVGRALTNQKPRHSNDDSALEMLKKRYVKGEISKVEFEQMKKDILETK